CVVRPSIVSSSVRGALLIDGVLTVRCQSRFLPNDGANRARKRTGTVRSSVALPQRVELDERRFDGGGGRLAETADRRIAHRLAELGEQLPLGLEPAARSVAREARKQLFLAHGADPA